MKLQMIGCSHHTAPVEVRERLAFNKDQASLALQRLRQRYPTAEAVLLSTCNRVELYVASEQPSDCPSHHDMVSFLAEFHGLDPVEVFNDLFERTGEDFVRHLFTVAASLDSMVVGEAQILAQVKQAYELATASSTVGPLTNAAFQAALKVAKRVATETAINQRRVSIPSVAVGDFASQFFERFDDKHVLVIGAGEMGEETLRYLIDAGVRKISICNRNFERAQELGQRMAGQAEKWDKLYLLLAEADLVVSATGANDPILTVDSFKTIVEARYQRPILILDLAIPRDFEPEIGKMSGVYLYAIDDLQEACQRNRRERELEWPQAEKIIQEETQRFMTDLNHRATAPTIRRLKLRADEVKADELARLLNKLGRLDPKVESEIRQGFDRLVNKLLHPPLESLRDEAQHGAPHGLLDALKRLFKLKD
ncbi:Glutamyl-tRNA reductase [Anatilimnocola aggregata]|uniref:Glutamyl-tRNA reductase n=1 Tax=Anatilimnocola aggregata TaxID=2528021 RepID=A0A517Y6S6_9BACT|nr:glutamyl-tRNA reductase [Anatilimnocola aggregata]QDU25933.1 Glutamyl-tRNA reductase [Anatilimnocola aggregata]